MQVHMILTCQGYPPSQVDFQGKLQLSLEVPPNFQGTVQAIQEWESVKDSLNRDDHWLYLKNISKQLAKESSFQEVVSYRVEGIEYFHTKKVWKDQFAQELDNFVSYAFHLTQTNIIYPELTVEVSE